VQKKHEKQEKPKHSKEEKPKQDDAEWNDDEGETTKKHKKKNAPRKHDFSWKKDLKDSITLETPVPAELPEMKKPNLEDHKNNKQKKRDEMAKITEKIDKTAEDRKKWNAEQRAERMKANEAKNEFYENKKDYITEKKKLNEEITKISEEKKKFEKPIKDLEDKMAVLLKDIPGGDHKVKSIREEIENLEYTLANSPLTGTEEREFLKKLSVLKKAEPKAEEYLKLKKEVRAIKDQRKPIMDQLKPLIQKRNELNALLDNITKTKPEGQGKEGDEKAERPKDKFTLMIDDLILKRTAVFESIKKLDEKYDAEMQKYHDYLDLNEKRNFILYIQGKIKERQDQENKFRDGIIERLTKEISYKIKDADHVENQEDVGELAGAIEHLESQKPLDVKTLDTIDAVEEEAGFDADIEIEGDFKAVTSKKLNKQDYLLNNVNKNKKKRSKKGKKVTKAPVIEEAPEAQDENADDSIPLEERPVVVAKRWASVLVKHEVEAPTKAGELDVAIQSLTAKKNEIVAAAESKKAEILDALNKEIASFKNLTTDELKKLDHDRFERSQKNRGTKREYKPRRQREEEEHHEDEQEEETEVIVIE